MALFHPVELARPKTLQEAVQILSKASGTARLVAGNTTLYDLAQHSGLDDIKTLVDISHLGLDYIEDAGDELIVGAAATFSEIANFNLKKPQSGLEALFETAGKITPPQVRNMGTIGGSLCSGIPFLDMPTTALALGCEIETSSPRGERRIKADDHFVDYFQTAVELDEIVTAVHFRYSEKQRRAGSSFIKLGRVTVDFAVVNVTSYVALDEQDQCTRARIALGAVANTPVRWESLEKNLVGKKVFDRDSISSVIKVSKLDFEPSPTLGAPTEYKKLVIPALVRDSLLESFSRAHRMEMK